MLSVGTTALLLVPQLFADRERSVAAIYVILRGSERTYSFATLQSSRSRRSASSLWIATRSERTLLRAALHFKIIVDISLD